MKSQHQQRVERFLIGAGHQIPDSPTIPSEAKRALQAKLLFEETMEAIDALGFTPMIALTPTQNVWLDEWPVSMLPMSVPADLVDIAKELADVSVVATGTMSLYGIHDEPLLAEVDGNNLLKLATGTHRADGKFLKSPTHPKPAIGRVLAGQDGDAKTLFHQTVLAELLILLQHDRFGKVNRDVIWITSMMAYDRGETAQEAAHALFRALLSEDLGALKS